jgi:phosphoserine phosphatase
MQAAGVRVVLVSGGLRQGILPMARELGIAAEEVRAVDLYLDEQGSYRDFDRGSPLATSAGKEAVVRDLALDRPALAMGDGATDIAMKPVVDCFAAFVGFARRPNVVAAADVVIESFEALAAMVVG